MYTKSKKKMTLYIMIFLIVFELILRFGFGFCDAPLFLKSEKYEYIYAPNQHRFRFGKEIYYNEYSMRSEAIDSTKIHVLGLGDSVINGGVQTDQSTLATNLVSSKLSLQLLNISAGSWGPDNVAAYLMEKGLFNAKAMILVVSSHDAHDNMDFKEVVDKHLSYPSRQYKLAIWELIERYLIPRFIQSWHKSTIDPDQAVAKGIQKKGKIFNVGFDQLKFIAKKANIPLIIYLHPEKVELQNKNYNEQGLEIIRWGEINHIEVIKGINIEKVSNFRDAIHINDEGQKLLANSFAQILKNIK